MSFRAGVAVALAVLSIVVGCARMRTPAAPSSGPVVRVALARGASGIEVSSRAPWRVAFEGRSRVPLDAPAGTTWTFEAERGSAAGRIRIVNGSGQPLGSFDGTLVAYSENGDAPLETHDRAYRGYFVVTAEPEGLFLVNRLRMEDYVGGVVGNEIGKTGGDLFEAIKAQAVAARTYAMIRVQKRARESFDLTDDHMDQVYTGVTGESDVVLEACRETAGEVVTRGGRPVEAVYSSTCGGRTATRSEVWGESDEGHLRSRKDRQNGRDLCQDSPLYRWTVSWTAEEFVRIASANYPHSGNGSFPAGELESVKVRDRTSSGRVQVLEIETRGGSCRLERDGIRWVLRQPKTGTPLLPSSAFEVEVQKRDGRIETVVAKGRGYGHGVGMCQFGAMGLSRLGHGYEDILRYYYHGVHVERVY
jgi:stage II sporulation protein D